MEFSDNLSSTMNSLGDAERVFREGQLVVEEEHLIGEYFALEEGRVAERLMGWGGFDGMGGVGAG